MLNQTLFQVMDCFSIEGRGMIIAGQVTQGTIRKGMKCVINNKESRFLKSKQVMEILNL